MYLRIIYFAYAFSKWITISKCTSLLVLFTGAAAAAVFGTSIVPLTCDSCDSY